MLVCGGWGWGVDGGWMPLSTCLQQYCNPVLHERRGEKERKGERERKRERDGQTQNKQKNTCREWNKPKRYPEKKKGNQPENT